ncbi:MAG TPA: pyridoxal-phosphate dependent enzyme [Acidimicrobiales bacterium]|nr:pyridoxal-phosphate dependent enzyme [Acidimicrobiales bacterium]
MTGPAGTAGAVGTGVEDRHEVTLTCVDCGSTDQNLSGRCLVCEGLVEASYPETDVVLDPADTDSLETYWRLLPIPDRSTCRIAIGPTPTILLAELDGVPIYAKVEGVLPTASTKDRLIAVSLPLMLEREIKRFIFSSTGNTAAAYAWGLQYYPELSARVYVSVDVPAAQLGPPTPALEVVRVDGDYVAAGNRSRAEVRPGETSEGGFFNLGRREGAKLAYLEAYDDVYRMGGQVDTVVQAVASGLGIVAAARAAEQSAAVRAWGQAPRLFCAQQTSCSPMVRAYRSVLNGSNLRLPEVLPEGLASAILLGDPFTSFDYVARAVRQSDGGFVDVTSSEIAAALQRHSHEVPLGDSAAVALASVYRMWEQGDLRESEGVLVALTGGPGR